MGTSNLQNIVVQLHHTNVFSQPATPSLHKCGASMTWKYSGITGRRINIQPAPEYSDNTFWSFESKLHTGYIYYKVTCTDTPVHLFAERSITVNPAPVIDITGMTVNHCDNDPEYKFYIRPCCTVLEVTGVFTGDGITDLGGGNAVFSPSSAGIGGYAFI